MKSSTCFWSYYGTLVYAPGMQLVLLTAVSLDLAEAPCGPIGMRSPDDLTRELFGAPSGLA